MLDSRKVARLEKVNELANRIIAKLDDYVYETCGDLDWEKTCLKNNKKLVQELVAASRELGKDFSDVIR